MKAILSLSAVLNLILGLSLAQAEVQDSVKFDSKVREFISAPQVNSTQELPVLILFERAKKSKISLRHAEIMGGLHKLTQMHMTDLAKNVEGLSQNSVKPLWLINGVFANLSAAHIQEVAKQKDVRQIVWGARPIKLKTPKAKPSTGTPSYTYGLEKIGVKELRSTRPELLGTGVRVGVLDTGITITHPDLKGKLRTFKNFSPAKVNTPVDPFGHGTHVSGTIAGGNASGLAIGVAPNAEIIFARIFDGNGNSDNKSILEAMQWMADPDEDPTTNDFAQVVNSSWGDDVPYNDHDPLDDPFCRAIDAWVDLGIIPVFSAGNTGPKAGTINNPGSCPQSFTVGATEQQDRSPHFSSTGPAIWKNFVLNKPDISAPGFKVKSANRLGYYEEMSGTSMAAPHVTGAFAILLQAFPQATPEQLKAAMIEGAKDLGVAGQDPLFGWGRVDLVRSMEILQSTN